MQDLGAGIAFWWFRSNVALLLKNSIRDRDASIAATLRRVPRSIRDRDASIAATLVTSGS